jgi:hypothetical protein
MKNDRLPHATTVTPECLRRWLRSPVRGAAELLWQRIMSRKGPSGAAVWVALTALVLGALHSTAAPSRAQYVWAFRSSEAQERMTVFRYPDFSLVTDFDTRPLISGGAYVFDNAHRSYLVGEIWSGGQWSYDISVTINTCTGAMMKSLSLPLPKDRYPLMAASSDGSKIYATVWGDRGIYVVDPIVVVDPATNEVTHSLAGQDFVNVIRLFTDATELYVLARNDDTTKLFVFDTTTDTYLRTIMLRDDCLTQGGDQETALVAGRFYCMSQSVMLQDVCRYNGGLTAYLVWDVQTGELVAGADPLCTVGRFVGVSGIVAGRLYSHTAEGMPDVGWRYRFGAVDVTTSTLVYDSGWIEHPDEHYSDDVSGVYVDSGKFISPDGTKAHAMLVFENGGNSGRSFVETLDLQTGSVERVEIAASARIFYPTLSAEVVPQIGAGHAEAL